MWLPHQRIASRSNCEYCGRSYQSHTIAVQVEPHEAEDAARCGDHCGSKDGCVPVRKPRFILIFQERLQPPVAAVYLTANPLRGTLNFRRYIMAVLSLLRSIRSPDPRYYQIATLSSAQNAYVSRLHVRYDAAHFPEDLVFQETGDRQNFQSRFVLRHPWRGESECDAAKALQYRTCSTAGKRSANACTSHRLVYCRCAPQGRCTIVE